MKTNSFLAFINSVVSNIDNFVYKMLIIFGMPKNALIFKFDGNSVPEIDLDLDLK